MPQLFPGADLLVQSDQVDRPRTARGWAREGGVMADFDRGFKEVARTAGPHLARLAGVECERWEPIVSELQMAERLADRAFRARRGRERFVVYFEAYTD